PGAIPPLREGLRAPYRSVQAHCARSLATLGDIDIAPVLLDRLNNETDKGLQIAFAAALGTLRWIPATAQLLELLWNQPPGHARREIALALARIIGEEHFFVNLIRHRDKDIGTALSQAVTFLGKKLSGEVVIDLPATLTECADNLARNEIGKGLQCIIQAIEFIPTSPADSPEKILLNACAAGLEKFGAQRIEYLVLTLHTLKAIIENGHAAMDL
ncbi:MAG: HEAT repeat domain-containing protein, partial [Anaerolineales bacterium]|nr:HEAT repeat domain-containing protein [Anaerolineales bacterium]